MTYQVLYKIAKTDYLLIFLNQVFVWFSPDVCCYSITKKISSVFNIELTF